MGLGRFSRGGEESKSLNEQVENIENLKSVETLVGIYQSASTKKTVSFPLKK